MLEDVKSNIARLIALYEAERQRADILAGKLASNLTKDLAEKIAANNPEAVQAIIEKAKEQIAELNQQIDNLELLRAFQAAGDPAESKVRIERLIHEIDKCIKLLEN